MDLEGNTKEAASGGRMRGPPHYNLMTEGGSRKIHANWGASGTYEAAQTSDLVHNFTYSGQQKWCWVT